MSEYTLINVDDVEDHYAGSERPRRVPLAGRRARDRAGRGHADPDPAALRLRAGHRPLPRRAGRGLHRHARDADDALRRRHPPGRPPARSCAWRPRPRARTATRATSRSSCGRSRRVATTATRRRSTTSGRRRRTPPRPARSAAPPPSGHRRRRRCSGVPSGSISSTSAGSSARGQCSTPRGTTNSSPASSSTSRSRSWIVRRPERTRKKSSVSSCCVPHELAVDLDDGELVVVQRADDPGLERGVEQRELLGEVDLGVHAAKGARAGKSRRLGREWVRRAGRARTTATSSASSGSRSQKLGSSRLTAPRRNRRRGRRNWRARLYPPACAGEVPRFASGCGRPARELGVGGDLADDHAGRVVSPCELHTTLSPAANSVMNRIRPWHDHRHSG